MPNQTTATKKPLDAAINRQQAINAVIKSDAALLKVQKTLSTIGVTVPPAPKTPAS